MDEQSIAPAADSEAVPPPPSEPPALQLGPPAGPVPAPTAPSGTGRPNWLWYSAVSITVVVTLGGLGMLYVDDTAWQRQSNQLTRQNNQLAEQNAAVSEQLVTAQTSLADSQQLVGSLQQELKHPHLEIWNVNQRIDGADWYLAGGVPDTFTYHLNATSSGPMSVSILTFEQFASAIQCVDSGVSNTNYCMHHSSKGAVKTWANVSSVSYDFHMAEGCANYLVVFTAAKPVTVRPNVSVTYNPAPTFTGDC